MRSQLAVLAFSAGAAALAPLAGCAGPGAENSPQTSAPVAQAAPAARASCYVHLPDTQIAMAEQPDGITLTYATQPNDVTTLRSTVREFARRQNRPLTAADPENAGDVSIEPGLPGAPPGSTVLAPGAHADVADVPGGARLTLTPVPESIRDLFRREVAEHRRNALSYPRCPPATVFTPSIPTRPSGP